MKTYLEKCPVNSGAPPSPDRRLRVLRGDERTASATLYIAPKVLNLATSGRSRV